MADNLPARRETRFPERRENRGVVYGNITDAGGDRPPPRTQYVPVDEGGGRSELRWTGGPLKQVQIPRPLPRWLGNQRTLGYTWLGAMIVISFDEWHNNHILPRPARLWYTSLTYGMLMVLSLVDAMIPVANAIGIGFFIMLAYQYFNGTGQFA
jgi:hypothetical protein